MAVTPGTTTTTSQWRRRRRLTQWARRRGSVIVNSFISNFKSHAGIDNDLPPLVAFITISVSTSNSRVIVSPKTLFSKHSQWVNAFYHCSCFNASTCVLFNDKVTFYRDPFFPDARTFSAKYFDLCIFKNNNY